MEVKIEVCKSCKKLFHAVGSEKICRNCKVEQVDEFKKCKAYIRAHKGAGVEEVARECDVTHKQILNWVREERLYFDDAAKVSLPCMGCGKMIPMGKYCPACLVEYKDQLKVEEKKPKGDFTINKGKGKSTFISLDHK